MAFTATNFTNGPLVNDKTTNSRVHIMSNLFGKTTQYYELPALSQGVDPRRQSNAHVLTAKFNFSNQGLLKKCEKTSVHMVTRASHVSCWSSGTSDTETEESARPYNGPPKSCSSLIEDEEVEESNHSTQGLAEACKFVYNDAKFVNERARNDIFLLSRGILQLDARARQDVAILGLEFLKLDARAREDTEKIDRDVKEKAERLHHITTILKDKAQSRLKSAADKHWSDGALEADLRRADLRAKQRAMEDALMALEFVKNIHDMMVTKMDRLPLPLEKGSQSADNAMGHITLEKNGKTLGFFPGIVSTDRITAIQEAYESMASALSEADGIDYTDPEELELLIATLIDLDAMDGKSSVSLLAECSSSPDVNTRQALANALAAAPSMWTLGNAGMGALQRLAEDSNPAIAAAASKTIYELKKQWEIEEGDSWRFMMNQNAIDIGTQDVEEEDDDDE